MFVIIKNGGKQYFAKAGDVLQLEKIEGNPGEEIELETILNKIGNNLAFEKKTIKAMILKHYKDDKIIVFKKKKRHHYERKKGHRQQLTNVKIQELN